ncbi:MAG: hypothetical protein GC202_14490 [Alphaproteobacteria bacterium]|nr:hypothetical protein [Alphaproteobacteria bacterium]
MTGSITPPGGGAANLPPAQAFAQIVAQVTQLPAQIRNQVFAAVQTMTLASVLSQGTQAAPVPGGAQTQNQPQTQLPPNQVQGQVIGRDTSGATLVKTDAGTIGVKLPQPLPQGASVTLQIGGTAQAPQATILQVQPQAPATPPAAAAPTPAPAAAATNIAANAQSPQPSVQTTATVVSPPPAQPAGPQAAAALQAPAAQQTAATRQAQTPPQTATAPQAQPLPGAAVQQTLQTGASVQVRVVPDVPTATAQQTANAAAPPATPTRSQFVETLTARVVAHTPNGQTVVDTSVGRLAMTWPAGVPKPAEGARLALEVTMPALAKATADVPLKTAAPLAHEWPNLKQALKELADADPALARRVVDEGLPRPGPKLATQVMSFLATDRTDARSVLGDAVANTLERAGRGELLQRLDSDLRDMQRLSNAPGDWRAVFVPIWDGQEMRQMRLFSRREGEKGKRDRESRRFVVELDFSELGEVQIDGLMRKPMLELMLRTHREIPPEMRDEIEVVFLDGCTLSGLAGRIYFQAVDRFPVAPLEEIQRRDRGMTA